MKRRLLVAQIILGPVRLRPLLAPNVVVRRRTNKLGRVPRSVLAVSFG